MEFILYSKENCSLCDKAKVIVEDLQKEYEFTFKEVDIYKDDALLELYQIRIPVLENDGEVYAEGIFHKEDIRKRLHEKLG
ncbi:glutaredoxin family protein [Bacillus alkalisoli]|uniref:glutaredoxin family protein n=1 Tax=Bacillus alkalisoli TaxID=2011008 RepID=UPI000C2374BA|nr:glutaredoxin family protein [Bacillus alkalisoli]